MREQNTQNTILEWVTIGLSLIMLTSLLMSFQLPQAGQWDVRAPFILLFLIPISIAVFFLDATKSLIVGFITMILCVFGIVQSRYYLFPFYAWKKQSSVLSYIGYLTDPLFTTGIIWELIIFVIVAYWAGSLYEQYRDKAGKVEELFSLKRTSEIKLADELEHFSSLQKRYYEDTNRLNSLIMTLSDLARKIPSVLRLEGLFKLIMEKAAELFSASNCAIFYVDSVSGKLTYAYSIGYDEKTLKDLKLVAGEESGIIGWCAKHSKFLSVTEVENDPYLADLSRQNRFPVSFCQPILERGKTIMVLCVGEMQKPMKDSELMRLSSFLANLSSIAIENAKLMEKTREQAIRDGLTGLYNHKYFYELLEGAVAKAGKSGDMMGVFLIDIDHFKNFNDTYGHQTGDFILQKIAQTLREKILKDDTAARYGGEEFAIICVRKDVSSIEVMAEVLRKTFEQSEFKSGEIKLKITISLGIAHYDPKKDGVLTVNELIRRSDNALYKAKESGRNRVCVYQQK